jgi:hypothetical protein
MTTGIVEGTVSKDGIGMTGYLYKKTRDGRWQRRWFETNGVYLTYYKSRKVEKLLAALSLPQVGEIRMLDEEEETGLFCIELNSRTYTLRAKSNEEAKAWVTVLQTLRLQGDQPVARKSLNDTDKIVLREADELGASGRLSEWDKNKVQKRFTCC